nr:hypothetical protein [Tanacetum cinerariifolium]
MIIVPGDPNSVPLVAESSYEQTDDVQTEKEAKQMEADDQTIQTILMGLLEDIYAARISSNPRNRQIAQPGMNIGQDRQIQMIRGHGGNQPPGAQNVGNQNGLIVVPGIAPSIANQNANQNENGNVVATWVDGNANGNNGNQIRCYNYRGLGHNAINYTVRLRRRDATYLQPQLLIAQKEAAGIQLQAEEFDLMAARGDIVKIEGINGNYVLMANCRKYRIRYSDWQSSHL